MRFRVAMMFSLLLGYWYILVDFVVDWDYVEKVEWQYIVLKS